MKSNTSKINIPKEIFENIFMAEGGEKRLHKSLTGNFQFGLDKNSPLASPNAILEKDEFLKDSQGVRKVEGKTHKEGGVDVVLEDGSKILSDKRQIGKELSKELSESYEIKLKPSDTFAGALEKINKKLGLDELIEQEEKLIEKVDYQQKNTKDPNTLSANTEALSKQIKELNDKKTPIEEQSSAIFEQLFEAQEREKQDSGESNSSNYFAEGGEYQGGKKEYAYNYLINKGMPPHVAAGIVGNLAIESGNFDENVINFKRRGDKGTSYGVAQWRGTRKNELIKFAGDRAKTLEGQLDFLIHELETEPKYGLEEIMRTGNTEQATRVFMNKFERPNRNPKINHISKRIKEAGKVHKELDSTSQPITGQASIAPTKSPDKKALPEPSQNPIQVPATNQNRFSNLQNKNLTNFTKSEALPTSVPKPALDLTPNLGGNLNDRVMNIINKAGTRPESSGQTRVPRWDEPITNNAITGETLGIQSIPQNQNITPTTRVPRWNDPVPDNSLNLNTLGVQRRQNIAPVVAENQTQPVETAPLARTTSSTPNRVASVGNNSVVNEPPRNILNEGDRIANIYEDWKTFKRQREIPSVGSGVFGSEIDKSNVGSEIQRLFPSLYASNFDEGAIAPRNTKEFQQGIQNYYYSLLDSASRLYGKDSDQYKALESQINLDRFSDGSDVRGFDNKFGNFTSTRPNYSFSLLPSEVLQQMNEEGINTAGQLKAKYPDVYQQYIGDLEAQVPDDVWLGELPESSEPASVNIPDTPSQTVSPVAESDNLPAQPSQYQEVGRTGVLAMPDQSPLTPTPVASHLKTNRRYERMDFSAISPEQQLVELNKLTERAETNLDMMPSQQKAAVSANMLATQADETNKILFQTEQFNRQGFDRINNINSQIQMSEANAGAQDALNYEQRQLLALAKTEADYNNYYNRLQKNNLMNFNEINNLNLMNQLYDNFQFTDRGVESKGAPTKFTFNPNWNVTK